MIQGDRDTPKPAPTIETPTRTRSLKYPFLNLALAFALAPAVLACGSRPTSTSRPVEKANSAPARSVEGFDQVVDPETPRVG